MQDTVILLAEVPKRTDRLEVLCRKCDRRGVLSVARLVQEHGSGFPMSELRRMLAGNYERLKAAKPLRAASVDLLFCRLHPPHQFSPQPSSASAAARAAQC